MLLASIMRGRLDLFLSDRPHRSVARWEIEERNTFDTSWFDRFSACELVSNVYDIALWHFGCCGD